MACSKYISTKETTHAARVSRLLVDPCTDLFRDILRNHVTEIQFPGVLQKQKNTLSPILNRVQREALYPRSGNFNGTYAEFDLSLLYILMRNISGITPHQRGWAKSPNPSDRSLSANIDRIREIRNTYCGHAVSVSLSDTEFQKLWQDLIIIVSELEGSLPGGCTTYTDAANMIKTVSMDPEQEKVFLDMIDEQHQYTEDLKVTLITQGTELMELKAEQHRQGTEMKILIDKQHQQDKHHDLEGRNILENTKAVLKAHTLKKVNTRTASVQTTINKLRDNHIAILTGKGGSGKTTTAYQVMCEMSNPSLESPYTPVLIKSPEQWNKVINPSYRYLVYLDDVIGSTNLDTGAVEKWKNQLDVMISCAKTGNVMVLIGLRKNILDEARECYVREDLDDVDIVDLSSEDNFTMSDKMEMLKQYEDHSNFIASELSGDRFSSYSKENGINAVYRLSDYEKEEILFANPYYGFPLTCVQFFSRREFFQLGHSYFIHPDKRLFDAIENMRRAKCGTKCEKVRYCVLCYTFVNGTIEPNCIDDNLLKNICEKLRIVDIIDIDIKDAIDDLSGLFLSKSTTEGVYIFSHESVLETVLVSFGQLAPDIVIKRCSEENMYELIRTQNYVSKPGEVVLKIPKRCYENLRQRLLDDGYYDGEAFIDISIIMHYPVLYDPEFVSFFFDLKFSDEVYSSLFHACTMLLANTKSRCNNAILRELLERFGPHHTTVTKCKPHSERFKLKSTKSRLAQEKSKFSREKNSVHLNRSTCIHTPFYNFHITNRDIEKALQDCCVYGERAGLLTLLQFIRQHCDLHSLLSLNDNTCSNLSVLHCSILYGWEDLVDMILEMHTPTRTKQNWSCLHLAACAGRSLLLQKFIKLGHDINERTLEGFSVLQTALLGLRYGHTKICLPSLSNLLFMPCFLLMNLPLPGSDDFKNVLNNLLTTNTKHNISDLFMNIDQYGNSIMHYLVIHNYIDILDLLLKYSKDIALSRNISELPTALHVAVYLGRPEIVRKLWKMGKYTNDRDMSFLEALHRGEHFCNKKMSNDILMSHIEGLNHEHEFKICWNDRQNEIQDMKLRSIEYVKVVFGNVDEFRSVKDFLQDKL